MHLIKFLVQDIQWEKNPEDGISDIVAVKNHLSNMFIHMSLLDKYWQDLICSNYAVCEI